jgi:hypothetical protein
VKRPGRAPVEGAPQAPARRGDQVGAHMAPEAYRPLKELSQTSGISIRDLLSEAVTLLLIERSQKVPPELRAKFRGKVYGLD